jgi:twitching motility two-component system response regulator PilH
MSLILIADDNPHAHRMGRQILNQEGYEVATTSDGDETLQYLTENHPDLVLADTRMPGPSGFEVCRRIKRHPKLSNIKVVLLAGPLEPFDPAQAESVGSDGVLHKPLDAYSLIDTVKSLIGEARLQRVSADSDAEPAASLRALDRAAPEAELADAPGPGESFDTRNLDSIDPFGSAVEEALSDQELEGQRRERVRRAVQEVLAASIPPLVDTITERVIERLKQT